MNKFLKQAAVLLLALTFIIPQMGCGSNGQNQNYTGISKTGFYLDTVCAITIYGVNPDSELGQELAEAMAFCSMICLIETKGSLSCSFVPDPVSEISDRFGITWKEGLWEVKR